jgi:hypothetical protein
VISISDINPTQLRDFAKTLGWTQVARDFARGFFVMRNPGFVDRELTFPTGNDVADFDSAITSVVEKLAYLHKLTIEKVLTGAIEVTQDVVRYRIHGTRVRDTEIPLTFARQVLAAAELIILSSAATVVNPRLHHPRLATVEAQEMLGTAKLGQTEEGSFVVKVSCGLHAIERTVENGGRRLPLVRAATLAAHQSVSRLVEAIERDAVEDMTNDLLRANAPNVSANLCEALTRLHDDLLDNAVDVSFSLAQSDAALAATLLPPVRIQREYFPVIEEVRKELRSVEGPQNDIFMGSVEALQGVIDQDGRRSGDVILSLFVEGEPVRARASLNADQYQVADRAHMTNGAYIFVQGTLHGGRQPRALTDVDLFQQAEPNQQPPAGD